MRVTANICRFSHRRHRKVISRNGDPKSDRLCRLRFSKSKIWNAFPSVEAGLLAQWELSIQGRRKALGTSAPTTDMESPPCRDNLTNRMRLLRLLPESPRSQRGDSFPFIGSCSRQFQPLKFLRTVLFGRRSS